MSINVTSPRILVAENCHAHQGTVYVSNGHNYCKCMAYRAGKYCQLMGTYKIFCKQWEVPILSIIIIYNSKWSICMQCIVPQIFKPISMRQIFINLVIRFITNRKQAFVCMYQVSWSPDNITIIHWINNDHELL